jgi:hypothetical protein
VKFYGAVAAEYMVRARRHQAAGLSDLEAHHMASLETRGRRRAVLDVLKKANVKADDPMGLSLLAAHGWELYPAVPFPSETEHECTRAETPPAIAPGCRACGETTFWVHYSGGLPVCARCHPPASPLIVGRWCTAPSAHAAGEPTRGAADVE